MKRLLLVLISVTFATSLMAQVRVYTPSLKSPLDSAVNQLPDTYISWNAITGSLGLQYRVQLDTTPDFNSPLLVDTTQTLITGYKTRLLLFGHRYYWRVLAIDEGQTSSWSNVWSFLVFDQVTLYKPSDASVDAAPNVSIEWKNTVQQPAINITGVAYFDYEIDITPLFNSPMYVSGTTAGTVYKVANENLYFGQEYYWRVRARHAAGFSSWSTPFSFTVTNTIALDKPADAALDQMLDVLLKWKVTSGLLAYYYEVALDTNFTALVEASEADTTFINTSMLQFGIKYYWRVRGRHSLDTTGWSVTRALTTINTVLTKYPDSSSTGIAVNPTFTWTAQTGIAKFQLQVSETPDFANPYFDVTPDATSVSFKTSKKLKSNYKYYWHMRAISDGTTLADTTEWSPTWPFVTTHGVGIEEPGKAAISVYPNPAHGKIFITVEMAETSTVSYSLVDLLGKTVLSGDMDLTAGTNNREIILQDVRKGIYILRVQINGNTINQKLIVE